MLHDSNRPLRLQFYPSLRPEMTMGTDRSHRAVPYLRSWFTHGQAQFSSVIYHSTRKQLLIDRARLEPAEATVLQMRANLMSDLRLYIEKHELTQAEAAKRLGIAQSRVSDLVRGKWEKFSLEMLITLEARLGRTVRVELAA